MREPPGSAVSEYGAPNHQELPHVRHQYYLLGLTGLKQPFVEALDVGVVPAGNQSRHVEGFSHPRSSTPDGPTAPESSRVAIEESDSYQSRELPTSEGAQLRKFGQERPAKNGTNPRQALQKGLVSLESGLVLDGFVEVPVGSGELLFQPAQVGLDMPGDSLGSCGAQMVFLGGHYGDDLGSSGEDRLKLPGFLIRKSPGEGLDSLGKMGEDPGIESIGFGELARGSGEVPTLSWVDYRNGDLCRSERGGDGTLEAAAGLQDHHSDRRLFSEPAHKLIEAFLIVGDNERFSCGEDGHVQASFGDILSYRFWWRNSIVLFSLPSEAQPCGRRLDL